MNQIFRHISLIFALMIELALLILLVAILFLGVLGVFLPFLPGLFFVALAAGIYSLLVRTDYGLVTPKVHRHLRFFKDKILNLEIMQKFMGLIKNIRQKQAGKTQEEILKHGLILFGFNTILILAFWFALEAIGSLVILLDFSYFLAAFLPLLLIFFFAAWSAIVWYRFGQILGRRLKKNKIFQTAIVVLISLLPLLMILLVLTTLINLVHGFNSDLAVTAFLVLFLMLVIAAIFELVIVSFGALTKIGS
jgi:hypothetical protein